MTDALLPWQQDCIDHLRDQTNVLITDDMGLGKTYEGIAVDQMRRTQSSADVTLIVAPIAMHQGEHSCWKESWERQTGMKAWVIDPKNRDASWNAFASANEPGAFIMHYEAIRLMPQLLKVKWLHVILDECHRIQNRKATQTRQVKRIKTQFKTGLSGTPTTGHPDKFWSVLNWLYPRVFTSYWRFYYEYVEWMEAEDKNGNKLGYKIILGPKNEKQLQGEIEPFHVRRTKKQVKELYPGHFELSARLPDTRRMVELHPEQRRAYNQMRDEQIAWVKELQAECGDRMNPVMAQNAAVRVMRLQQFGCAYARLETVMVKGEPTPKVFLSEPSTKLDEVMTILDDNPDTPFVVFSSFRQLIDLFEVRLQKKGIDYSIITGMIPASDRGEQIRKFQAGETRVFTGTPAAGGVGITLTRANEVILLDRHWSPAINEQAIARVDRIGQTQAVSVMDIVARGTVDLGRIKKIENTWSWVLRLLGDV